MTGGAETGSTDGTETEMIAETIEAEELIAETIEAEEMIDGVTIDIQTVATTAEMIAATIPGGMTGGTIDHEMIVIANLEKIANRSLLLRRHPCQLSQ